MGMDQHAVCSTAWIRSARQLPGLFENFFDGEHFVLKGGSSRTAGRLLRRSFRNWFRPNYPYVYARSVVLRAKPCLSSPKYNFPASH